MHSLLLLPIPSLAQGGASVSGRVVDSAAGAPIGLVTVTVQNAASGDTLSAIGADTDGRFRIRGLQPGRYTIHLRFPGFRAAQADVLVSPLNPSYDLGDLRMVRAVDLEQVMVTASAIRAAGIDTCSPAFRCSDRTA